MQHLVADCCLQGDLGGFGVVYRTAMHVQSPVCQNGYSYAFMPFHALLQIVLRLGTPHLLPNSSRV